MVAEQIVEIPVNRRITLDVPRTVPVGKTIVSFTPVSASRVADASSHTAAGTLHIEDIRRLLQKEMAEKGTTAIPVKSGDGWTAHVMEKYAESWTLNRPERSEGRFPS